jgi:hypothetical protein
MPTQTMDPLIVTTFLFCFYAITQKSRSNRDQSKLLSWWEGEEYAFKPKTTVGRFLIWITIPVSLILHWTSLLKDIFAGPVLLWQLVPDNPYWPAIWAVISVLFTPWMVDMWERWRIESRRNTRTSGPKAGLQSQHIAVEG